MSPRRFFCDVLLPVLAVVALAATSATAGPVNSCVLQEDTPVGQFKLSTLNGLFGELLSTESDGNIYFVSICRPIPQSFYDPRKLAGAIKLTSDGHTVDLGRIDQTNVIVNENAIVLTYVGGDRDKNFRDVCKGLRWKTYVMFMCDPFATRDVLTLIDDDPDQPDICQVWFEIKTSKTCVQQPYVPLDVLDKELSKHYKQIVNGKSTEILKIHSNETSASNKLSNYENHIFNTHQNFSKREVEENNNSLNVSSEGKPFTGPNSNSVVENKTTNNEEKENHVNKRIPEDKSYDAEGNNVSPNEKRLIITNPNHIIKTKTTNDEKKENGFHQDNSQTNSSEDKSFVNTYPNHINENKTRYNEEKENDFHQNNTHKISSEDEPFINTYPNDIENESRNNEKANDFHHNISYKLKPEDEPFMNIIPNHNIENETRSNETEEQYFNRNNSNKNSSEYEPFMNIIPHHSIENKTRNFEEKENNLQKNRAHNINSENEPFTNSYPNHIIVNKTRNNKTKENELHKNNSHQNRPEDKRYVNTNSDHISENKSAGNKEKEESSNENKHEEKPTHIKNNEERINNTTIDVENLPKYPEQKSIRDKSNDLDKDFKHVNHKIQNSNSSQNVTDENNYNVETNYSDKNKNISHYKSEDYYNKKHQNPNSAGLPVNNTYEINTKSTKNENGNRNFHQDISESTLHSKGKYDSVKSNNENKENSSSQNYTEKHPANNDVSNLSQKRAERTDEENKWGKNNSTDTSRVEKSIENGKSTHNNNSETKPPHNGDRNSSSVNNASNSSIVNDLNENNATNVHHEHVISHNSNRTEDVIKHQESGSMNITKLIDNYHENQSDKVKNESDKNHINELPHYNSTNDISEFNNTITNQKYTKNPPPKSKPQENPINSNSSARVLSKDENGDNSKATDNSGQPSNILNYFKNLYSKYFPDGFQLSTATIFGGLASFTAIFGLVGTAINRLYHKRTGTDQIPFKETFLRVYEYIRNFVTKTLCCCGRDLEEPDETNEKTPLLHPKNIPSPKVEDETYKKSSGGYQQLGGKNSANDDSSDKHRYGSTLDKTISPSFDSTYSRKKLKSKGKSASSDDSDDKDNESSPYGDKEKLAKVDNNLLGKSETGVVNKKTNSTLPSVKNIFRNSFRRSSKGGKEESGDNSSNTNFGTDVVRKSKKDKVVKKKSIDNEDSRNKSNKNRDGSTLDERISSPTFDSTHGKKKRKSKGKSVSSGDSDQDNDESSPYGDKEKLIQVDNAKNELKSETEAVNKKTNSSLPSVKNILRNSFRRSSKEGKEESGDNNSSNMNFETVVIKKIKEDKNLKKISTDQLVVPETKAHYDDDESVEVIEEIVYIDDGEEGEEIIEEIIETTTTVEELPETTLDEIDFAKCRPQTASGSHENPTTVTVRTSVRKISSSSAPGEVKTVEETFVNDNSQKTKKKGFGFKLGIGKSGGVNASVGEKKIELSKSGIKFGKRKEQEDQSEQEAMTVKLDKSGFKVHRNKNKSPVNMDGGDFLRTGGLDKQNVGSPEKSKKFKSKSAFKIFKRSISHPEVSDISEVENDPSPDDTIVKKEVPTTSAGLLNFGKTRSRSVEGDKKRTL